MYVEEYWFQNITKMCVIFRNVIQSLWLWGKIVAPKGIYCEKQRQIILEMSKLGVAMRAGPPRLGPPRIRPAHRGPARPATHILCGPHTLVRPAYTLARGPTRFFF